MLRSYYQLTKPRVMYGNLVTTVAGFLYASGHTVNVQQLLVVTLGTALIISSACVINNILDRDIDSIMDRTKSRPLVNNEVSVQEALVFGVALGLIGFTILLAWANPWITISGLVGFITYLWLYGELGKRISVHGTLVGAISGAIPIFGGYVAVSQSIDVYAVLLFLILFVWQIPAFYAISIFRKNEYAKASIPVSAVSRGVTLTKLHILIGALITSGLMMLLGFQPASSLTYLSIITITCGSWVYLAFIGIVGKDPTWARKMFRHSLLLLMIFSLVISLNSWLP